MDTKKIVNFIFELNQLKRQRHSGFQLAGVKNPDTIAEHVLRAAQIGYILAVMEKNPNPEKVTAMIMIHDNGEARIGDQNKVSARYFSNKDAEKNALFDQLKDLDEEIENKWQAYFTQFEERNTPEGIIAKDADWLEQAFQAKEYVDTGHLAAMNWIDNVEKALETKSAKELLAEMKKVQFTDWWKNLKKMTYEKLK